jgi:hypothetical protein
MRPSLLGGLRAPASPAQIGFDRPEKFEIVAQIGALVFGETALQPPSTATLGMLPDIARPRI